MKTPDRIKRLLLLLAHQAGAEVSVNELAMQLSMARPTVERYLDLLGEDSPPAVTPVTSPAGGPRSAADKVRLFRALFRGRDDVHARHWSNARSGKQGNTVFLDSDFVPYPDQWAYLAAIPRLAPAVVEAVVQEADHRGLVMGVKRAPAEDPELIRTRPPGRSSRSGC